MGGAALRGLRAALEFVAAALRALYLTALKIRMLILVWCVTYFGMAEVAAQAASRELMTVLPDLLLQAADAGASRAQVQHAAQAWPRRAMLGIRAAAGSGTAPGPMAAIRDVAAERASTGLWALLFGVVTNRLRR